MSILSTISKPDERPVIVTVCGDSGMGKTTLAATFPKPIVIRAEDGLQSIPANMRPDAFPLLSAVDQLWGQLKALLQEDHQYQTVIIDSVTALERMFIKHIVESDEKKPKSINQALGGYGAGLAAVAALHHRVRNACGMLNERRKMNVVFVAHADFEPVNLPDEDDFVRYSLRLGKKSIAPYVDDSDVVGFLKLETHVLGGDGERKKAISDGTRLLVCYANANSVGKNRYGITKPLLVKAGENPLIPFIPYFAQVEAKTVINKPDAQPKKGLTITSFDDEPAGTQPTQPTQSQATENTGA